MGKMRGVPWPVTPSIISNQVFWGTFVNAFFQEIFDRSFCPFRAGIRNSGFVDKQSREYHLFTCAIPGEPGVSDFMR